jgi:FtsH-binding integral membrane protein
MAYLQEGYVSDRPVAEAMPAERVAFIRKTYAHLAGAILVFAGLEALLLKGGFAEPVMQTLFASKGAMLVLMLVFIGGGYLAQYWAQSATSRAMQYAGLALYVLLEVVIFLPILYIADSQYFEGQYVIPKAGLLTLGVFAGLSMAVFFTGKDFSFLGPILCIAGWLSVAFIMCAMLFGLNVGTWFSFAMVGLAAAYIIYDTSNVLHRYRADQYVGAALQLFASVALMFYYVLRIFLSNSNRN